MAIMNFSALRRYRDILDHQSFVTLYLVSNHSLRLTLTSKPIFFCKIAQSVIYTTIDPKVLCGFSSLYVYVNCRLVFYGCLKADHVPVYIIVYSVVRFAVKPREKYCTWVETVMDVVPLLEIYYCTVGVKFPFVCTCAFFIFPPS